jgi:hypothetical protein
MPIEFRCSHCGKLLRTGDDTVGRQAQCPECGAISTVPSAPLPSELPTLASAPLTPQPGGNPFGPGPTAGAGPSDNPYQSPAAPAYLAPGQIDLIAAQRVAGPATALIVTAILGMILHAFAIVANVVQVAMGPIFWQQGPRMIFPIRVHTGFDVAGNVVAFILSVIVLFGAMKMKRLENYGFAMAAAIIAMIPCIGPCCILGLPFGIWALVVLSDGPVKAAFRS